MARRLFKGKDRRLIKKFQQVGNAIVARDTIALNVGKRTQAISTRTLMLDGPTPPNPLYAALQTLLARMTALLAMTH